MIILNSVTMRIRDIKRLDKALFSAAAAAFIYFDSGFYEEEAEDFEYSRDYLEKTDSVASADYNCGSVRIGGAVVVDFDSCGGGGGGGRE